MPIPDEKARAWTRPEDYWPTRRPARSGRPAKSRRRLPGDQGDPLQGTRLTLTALPYLAVLVGLAVLTVAIMMMAWPGRHSPPPTEPPAAAAAAEVGTAPKGWIQER
jgi:hypothetical protein